MWWAAVHVVSKAVVAAGTAAVPCTGDVVRLSMSLGSDTVDDPLLLRELADFTADCHRPALARMHRASAAAGHLMAYVGSAYFLDTAGFYDVLYSRRDRPAFARDPARDAGLEGAHPTCREWWRDGANGLRARLLAEIEPTTRDELIYHPGALLRAQHPGESTAALEDRLLQRFLAHRSGQRIGVSSVSYEPGVAESYRMGAQSYQSVAGGLVHATADVIDDVLSMGAAAVGMVVQGAREPRRRGRGARGHAHLPRPAAHGVRRGAAVPDGVLALRRVGAGDAHPGLLRPPVLLRPVGHGGTLH